MTMLTTGNLGTLDHRVAVPAYGRADIQAGIAHLGVGGFHRAHQAVYMDQLFSAGLSRDWGIVGIGLMPQDVVMRDALSQQDHLYTVMTKHAEGPVSAHVIASIIDYLFAPDDPEAVLSVLADPAIRIVSLTITEGGYHADQTTGELVVDDALRADLVPGERPDTAPPCPESGDSPNIPATRRRSSRRHHDHQPSSSPTSFKPKRWSIPTSPT